MINLLASIGFRPGKLENTKYGSFHPWYGSHARRIAENLSDAIPADTLVRNHSSASLMGALLNVGDEAVFLKALATDAVATGAFSKFHFTRPLASFRIRRCPICVQTDLERWGVAYWRIHHQLLPITRCHIHKLALEEACDKCGNGIWFNGLRGLIDLGVCHHCGSKRFRPLEGAQRRAYDSFEDMTERSLRGEAYELRPAHRLKLIKAMTKHATSSNVDLLALLLEWWGTHSIQDLYSQLGRTHTHCDITEILAGRRWISSPLIMIALTAFSKQYLEDNCISCRPESPFGEGTCTVALNEEYCDSQRCVHLLARRLGIPESRAETFVNRKRTNGLWSLSAERTAFEGLAHALGREYCSE